MNQRSHLFQQAVHWHENVFSIQNQLPANLISWLNETGSLTRRLRTQHDNQFKVELILQNWAHGFADETAILQQAQSRYQLTREVILHAGNQPVILARTVIPPSTLAFTNRKLSRLGTRPLGEVIFAYPDLQILRRQFSTTNFCSANLDQDNLKSKQLIWGRRTLYGIANHRLLVAEFFLPNCYKRGQAHP